MSAGEDGGGDAPGDGPDAAKRLLEAAGNAGRIESMSVEDIVAAYYEALSVRAHAEAARAEGGSAGEAEEALRAFDSRFHPRAMARLESMSAGLAERLERGDGDGDAGEDEFDRLRAAMSAAEFARQYDRGLRGG